MKTTDTHAFVNQFLVWLLVTFSVTGSLGVGTVWMRHQISALANGNRKLDARIAEISRRTDETKTLVAGEEIKPVLLQRNAEWHLGLVQATEAQVVRVTEDTMLRLAQRHNRELFTDRVASISFKIAAKN